MESFPPTMVNPASIRWRLETPAQVSLSPHSGSSQTSGIPYQRWVADLSWPLLSWKEASVLDDFLVRIAVDRFYFTPPHIHSKGAARGAPTVARLEDGQIATIRWQASVTGQLIAGDHIEVIDGAGHSRLLRVLVDVDSDPTGQARITTAPKLASIQANAVLRTAQPRCVMRIKDTTKTAIHYRGSSASADLKLVEAWPS